MLQASYEAQQNVAPFLDYPVLRKVIQTFTNDARGDFDIWATNGQALSMLQQAKHLLDTGALTEDELEQNMLRQLQVYLLWRYRCTSKWLQTSCSCSFTIEMCCRQKPLFGFARAGLSRWQVWCDWAKTPPEPAKPTNYTDVVMIHVVCMDRMVAMWVRPSFSERLAILSDSQQTSLLGL